MTDLESKIREALHAGEIERDELRYPVRRNAPRRHGRAVLMVACAAIVLAIAGIVVAIMRSGSGTSPATGPDGFVGYTWNIESIEDSHGKLSLPDALRTTITYYPGQLDIESSVFSVTTKYRLSADGYRDSLRFELAFSSKFLPAEGAENTPQGRLKMALDSILFETRGRLVGPTYTLSAHVKVLVDEDQLTLTTPNETIHLWRGAAVVPRNDFVGSAWRVAAVQDRYGTLDVPSNLRATIIFHVDGTFSADDTINAIDGTYRRIPNGYVVQEFGGTDVAIAAKSLYPDSRVAHAVDAVTQTRPCPAGVHGCRVQSARVRASLSGNTLTLVSGADVLALKKVGAAPRPTSSHTTPVDAVAGFVGYVWRVVSLTDGQGSLEVPNTSDATITFGENGRFEATDTVSGLSGRYRAKAEGYAVLDTIRTDPDVAANPPATRLFRGVDRFIFRFACVTSTDHGCRTNFVGATVSGGLLRLRNTTTTLVLERAGPAPPSSSTDDGAFIGTWHLADLHDSQGYLVVPDSVTATISFTRDGFGNYGRIAGEVRTAVGIHPVRAAFVATSAGYLPYDTLASVGGPVSYRGPDPATRAEGGIDLVAGASQPGDISASVSGNVLTLRAGDTTLTFHRR